MAREWFAVRVKPRQEAVAKMHFARQGFEVYLPQTVKTVRHARQVAATVPVTALTTA